MIILNKAQYHIVEKSLSYVSINKLFAKSVIKKHIDGKVYVDDISNPKNFYVIHPYGMSLLFGKIDEEFLKTKFINFLLKNNHRKTPLEFLQIYPTNNEKIFDKIIKENEPLLQNSSVVIDKLRRINFAFNPLKFKKYLSQINLDEFNFVEVDEALFNLFDGSVVPKKFWNNSQDFEKTGVGFSLIYDDIPVSIAFSSFIHNDELELAMETKLEYRKKKFGSITCAKLIKHSLDKGFTPVWACAFENVPSYNLALKLGFEPKLKLPYYKISKEE